MAILPISTSKYHVYKYKQGENESKTKEAAARFYMALADSEKVFEQYAKETDDSGKIKYKVLAVSILI